jgi:hypothetical protein
VHPLSSEALIEFYHGQKHYSKRAGEDNDEPYQESELMGDHKRKRRKGQPVRNVYGRIVGEIIDGCLVKSVRSSIHMLKDPRGWTWDEKILKRAELAGVRHTKILDEDTGVIYEARLSDFHLYGKRIDRGFGKQICLPLEHWKTGISPTVGGNIGETSIKDNAKPAGGAADLADDKANPQRDDEELTYE